jgi:hypothetical protein
MVEFKAGLRTLTKEPEIIVSDEQIDENGEVVKEPVIIFVTGKRG